jgi:hypothetical protein
MSAIDHARSAGWLPHPGPEHTRAVISILLFVASYALASVAIADLSVRGEADGYSFHYDGDLGVAGGVSASSGFASSRNTGDTTRAELVIERADDIEGNLEGSFLFWIVIGLVFSGRPRSGPKVGVAAGIFLLFALLGTRGQIESAFRTTDWPVPVAATLDFTWNYWTLLGLFGLAAVWNIVRWIRDRHGEPRTPALSEARS